MCYTLPKIAHTELDKQLMSFLPSSPESYWYERATDLNSTSHHPLPFPSATPTLAILIKPLGMPARKQDDQRRGKKRLLYLGK
jgi:hypothetical protein